MSTANLTEMKIIKRLLEEKGLKQTWLSEKPGKSYAIVSAYIQNRKKTSS